MGTKYGKISIVIFSHSASGTVKQVIHLLLMCFACNEYASLCHIVQNTSEDVTYQCFQVQLT